MIKGGCTPLTWDTDMMDEETRRDVVEAHEAAERAQARIRSGLPGSAHVHLNHVLAVLERILIRNAQAEGDEGDEGGAK